MFNPKNNTHRHVLFYFFDIFSSCMSVAFASSVIALISTYAEFQQIKNGSVLFVALILILLPISHLSIGLYDTKIRQSIRSVFRKTVLSSALVFGFISSVTIGLFNIDAPVLFCMLTLIMTCMLHTSWRLWVVYHGGIDSVKQKIYFVGAGDRASFVSSRMRRHVDRKHFIFGGFIPLKNINGEMSPINNAISMRENIVPSAGDNVDFCISSLDCDVFVLANDKDDVLPINELLQAKMLGFEILEMEDFVEAELGQIAVENMSSEWLLNSKGFHFSRQGYGYMNYLFNAFIAMFVLAITWPLIIGALIAIYLDDGRKDKEASIFYCQTRVGLNGKLFNIIKFRSMGKDAEANGAVWATKNDMRVTRVGNYLRKYRIDELPQLINVLKGEMCFVGPRPERPEFVKELSSEIPFFDFRHFVKPGLTGWAQVKYPYGASKNDSLEKLKFDLYYIKHKSFLMDILVLIRTVETVLFGGGR